MSKQHQILPQLWPVFALSRACGVLPITIKSNNPQINNLLLIYCIILNILYHLIDFYAIFNVAVLNLSKPNVGPYEILSTLTVIIAKVVLILNTYHIVINSKKVLFVLQEIISLNGILTIKNTKFIKIEIGIEVLFVVFISAFLNAYFSGIFPVDNSSLLILCGFVSVSLCVNLIQVQFYMICSISICLFKSINQELWEYDNNNRQGNVSITTEERINELRKSYRRLCNLIDLINELYEAHIMLNVTSMNVFLQTNIDDVLTSAYNVIFDIKQDNVGVGAFAILWIFYEACEISFYFLQGIKFKHETTLTRTLLSRISNSEKRFDFQDTVHWFSREVVANRVRLSAGIFNLDLEQLFIASGAIATNMAILLQSHVTSLNK